jgi:CopG family nickel-responsive transcriptional regulator
LIGVYKEDEMGELVRFGVSAEEELMVNFDRLSADKGYTNRSEALRDLMRDALVQARLDNFPDIAKALGSLTLVYDHHARELSERMGEIQHERHGLVVSVLHVHISHDDCMELIALRGKARDIRELANALLSLKGVKHGKLFLTLPAREIVSRKKAAHSHAHHKITPKRRAK